MNPTWFHKLGVGGPSDVFHRAGKSLPGVPVLSADADLAHSAILVTFLNGRVLDGFWQGVSVLGPFEGE